MQVKLLFLSLISFNLSHASHDEDPINFIAVKWREIPAWLMDRDPSHIQPKETHFEARNDIANLNCYIRNQRIQGHSKNIKHKGIMYEPLTGIFTFSFEMSENVTFFGDYRLSGTMSSGKLINSNGVWNITVPSVNGKFFEARVFFNLITNHVKIMRYNLRELRMNATLGHNDYFQNLLDQDGVIGYEEEVHNAIFDGFSNHIFESKDDPFRSLYKMFWNEVFEDVTIEDFVKATMPPFTTTQTQTTPTEPPTTTASPAICPSTGIELVPHPSSCTLYFLCVEGTPFEQECSEGLHFNPVTKKCDFPENGKCIPFPECPPNGVSFHPYPGNCTLYVICAEGTSLVSQCADGTCFDPEELKCRIIETHIL